MKNTQTHLRQVNPPLDRNILTPEFHAAVAAATKFMQREMRHVYAQPYTKGDDIVLKVTNILSVDDAHVLFDKIAAVMPEARGCILSKELEVTVPVAHFYASFVPAALRV